jgi:glutamate N-acetyltransferase / amino-acid N-acetyltransferase
MPIEKVLVGIEKAALHLSSKGGDHAAAAIMTTDTFQKDIAVELTLDGHRVTIGAMAKGSGMIHPNMATMLGFITTDANISHQALDKALKDAVNKSFNLVNVDGDTSTNDMVVALANGVVGNKKIVLGDENWETFQGALQYVCVELAKMIAKDGEGATKLVEILIKGAKTEEDAKKAAMAINKSSLVKTALFGEDANWGRIMAAVGYSGAEFDPEKVDIYLGEEKMAENGMGFDFSEDRAKEILSQSHIVITVDMKIGEHEVTAWGCDLSYKYVEINADYRT